MTAPMKSAVAVLALMGAVVASGLQAQEGPGPRGQGLQKIFATIDADDNGLVTEAEIEAGRAAEFAAADTNGDGLLSAAEVTAREVARFAERQGERSARMIEARDNNGDGSLSAAEVDEGPLMQHFARIDTDDDGAISEAEAEAARERIGRHRKGGKRGD